MPSGPIDYKSLKFRKYPHAYPYVPGITRRYSRINNCRGLDWQCSSVHDKTDNDWISCSIYSPPQRMAHTQLLRHAIHQPCLYLDPLFQHQTQRRTQSAIPIEAANAKAQPRPTVRVQYSCLDAALKPQPRAPPLFSSLNRFQPESPPHTRVRRCP